jgi:2-oxoglutarate ferredoxin oxidoreductase subunit alpha
MHMACVSRIYQKIEDHADEISQIEGLFLEGCKNLVVAYGTTTRSAVEAVQELRSKGKKDLGFLRLKTLWPFPDHKIRSMVGQLENVFFPEMNLGYMIHPLRETLRDRAKNFISIPCLGQLHSPDQIIEKIKETIGK